MNRSIQILVILCAFGLLIAPHSLGIDNSSKEAWKGKRKDGAEITESDLQIILDKHQKWLLTEGKEGERADLAGADLREANLERANLSKAALSGANLSDADLFEAKLNNASLYKAILINTQLFNANLSNAILNEANLSNAKLPFANLSNASLNEANLSNANLRDANLTECHMYYVRGFPRPEPETPDTSQKGLPIYEPKAGSVPDITSMVGLPNLEELTFENYPHGLVDLREGFKKLGYREQERKITYALKHSETMNSIKNSLKSEHKNYYKWVEGQLNLYLFEYTSKWGMSPGRPLFILLGIMVLFSFIYMFSLIGIIDKDGIWKVWIEDRVRSDLGEAEPKKPLAFSRAYKIWGYGIYFSLLSAFNIGWRELNVGNWIARVQPREYTLRASGWVRTVSGIQSLISVYLLALAVLTYFGRPFDQF